MPAPAIADTLPARTSLRDLVVRILIVALAYAASARLGLLLAIPPGYATAVWPASGVALAAVLLWGYRTMPGVVLGSFLVNISTSWESGTTALLLRSLGLALCIGCGAGTQALLGAWIIRRGGDGFRNIFVGEHEIIRILMLGGPVSCVVSASVGVASLWSMGLIPTDNLPFNWLTWWVGDSIGVLIFMPLICAWSLRPREQWRRQQIALSVPMGVVYAAVVALFFYVSAAEEKRQTRMFEDSAHRFSDSLQSAVDNNLNMLIALGSFHSATPRVGRREFVTFTQRLLPQYPEVQTVGWLPRVEQAGRGAFEQSMHDEGAAGYRIVELAPGGDGFVAAAPRAEYYPVAYIVPDSTNRQVVGFDVASEPLRRDAVRRALASGRSVATDWLNPLQDETPELSTLLYLAVYRESTAVPIGLSSAVLRLHPLLQRALVGLREQGLQVRVSDSAASTSRQTITMGADLGTPVSKIAHSWTAPIRVADRSWTVEFTLSAAYLVAHRSWLAWGVLAAGLSMAALLGMLLLVLLARQARIEEAVATRTTELRNAQEQLVGYAADLERSNKELAQFASVASHDLQAPVRGVMSFVQLLKERYSGKVLEGKGEEFLSHIEQSAKHMKSLIDGLLALSRIGRNEDAFAEVDCNAVLAEVESQLAGIVHERDALITHDRLPRVRGSRLEIFQVLQNLIVNGMKFQPGNAPRIHVHAQRQDRMWRISVRDHGIGIAPRHQERIFRIFQRLHSTAYDGTGIGLAICEKIVSGHGGRIWVESAPGRGATFHFTLPAVVDPD